VVGQERKLQEKEENSAHKLERESSELQSCTNDLSTHKVIVEVEWECLRKTREDLFTRELTITLQEGTLERRAIALTSREKELANKEKWLADAGLQELATKCKTMEQVVRHRRSGTSWARLKRHWCPSVSALSALRHWHGK
jgi:uncharacterized protein (DUF3084 family)